MDTKYEITLRYHSTLLPMRIGARLQVYTPENEVKEMKIQNQEAATADAIAIS